MHAYSDGHTVESLLAKVTTKDAQIRKKTSEALGYHLESAARELSIDAFTAFENTLYQRLFALVHSAETYDKMGGVQAIDALIDCTSAAAETKVIKFANILSTTLKSNTDFELMQLVAAALGHMARATTVTNVDYLEFELNRALEGLRADSSQRRLAACLLLKQVAENAPTIFFVRTKEFFEEIWTPLRDPKYMIRTSASEALSAALQLIENRKTTMHQLQWYYTIYDHIHVGLGSGSVEAIHGSLLVIQQALKHTGDFMTPRFEEICRAVMLLQDNKSKLIRVAMVELLPELAQFCPDPFARSYLEQSVTFLVRIAKSSELRPAAFTALGKLARAVRQYMVPYLDKLLELVHAALAVKRSKEPIIPEVLQCIADMVVGLRDAMKDHVLNLLDPMFANGLTPTLITTVTVVARHIPEHRRTIQRRLLEEVSLVLGSQAFEAPAKNPRRGFGFSRQRHSTGSLQGSGPSGLMSPRSKKSRQAGSDLVLLSLRTLGGLNMQECLLPFVQDVVLGYLDSPIVEIRAEAAATCCLLLLQKDQPITSRGPSATLLEEILQRLLQVAVGDLEPTVRIAVLTGLDTRFDRFLCQMHHVTTILFLLGDENFTIRVRTIALLGRLARMNPAAVLPPLRQHLLNLISGLTYGYDARFTEECIMLLCHFLDEAALQRIVRPFMSTIVHSLPLKDDVRLATVGLEAMGALCTVMRQDMMSYIDTLIPVIIDNMHDTSSTKKQEVSIRTLGQLVGATGYVVKPYMQYPNLLPRALELLIKSPATTPWSLRCETLRTIGILGALDPYKFQQLLEHLNRVQHQQEGQEAATHFIPLGLNAFIPGVGIASSVGSLHTLPKRHTITDAEHQPARAMHQNAGAANAHRHQSEHGTAAVTPLLEDDPATVPVHQVMYEQAVMVAIPTPSTVEAPRISPANADYYPRVAIRALMKILRDPSLSTHHNAVTQAIMHIFTSLGMRSVPYLDDIIPYMLQVVRQCNAGLRESLLQQLSSLAIILRHHLAPFLPGIFDVVVEYWHDNLDQVCALVEQIALASRDEVLPFIPRFLPLLLGNLSPPKHLAHDGTFVRTVACIEVLSPVLTSHVHLLVPALCTLVVQLSEMGQEAHQWKLQTLQAIESVSSDGGLLQCPQMAARIIHIVLQILSSYPPANAAGVSDIPESIAGVCERVVCDLLLQLGPQFTTFEVLILQQFRRTGLQAEQLHDTLKHLHASFSRSGTGARPFVQRPPHHKSRHMSERMFTIAAHKAAMMTPSQGVGKLPVMPQTLQRSWDVTQRSTAEDWNEWMRRFCVDLLKESPSPALRSCSGLAQAYIPLAKELFHAAFVSCWYELSVAYQENLVRSLELAFRSSTIPPEILQTLLNLAEFMEHDVSALPIDIRVLADLAQKCHAYAKALHYKELEFQTNPSQCVEPLISINKKLDMHDAAIGILKYAQKMQISSAITIKESWLAKLGDWEEALERYRERAEEHPTEAWPLVGQMKCLEALGHWEEAIEICTSNWDMMQQSDDKHHNKAAVIAARAAWALNDWKTMGDYAAYLGDDDVDGSFYRAVLAVHQESYDLAAQHINIARKHLDKSLTALLSESYHRSYVSLVMVQQLSELEEIIYMKRLSKDRSRDPEATEREKKVLLDKWRKRLQGCKTAVPIWLSLLTLRRMLISSKEDYDTWLDFEALCRHSGSVSLAKKILLTAQEGTKPVGGFHALNGDGKRLSFPGFSPSPGPDGRPMLHHSASMTAVPNVPSSAGVGMSLSAELTAAAIDARFAYAHQRQEWYVGRRKEAIVELSHLLERIPPNDTQLKVRCLLKLGQWKMTVDGPGENVDLRTRDEVLQLYHRATVLDPQSYRAWHEFALANYRASQEMRQHRPARGTANAPAQMTTQHMKPLLVNATQGLLKAIALGTKNWSASVQQDMLCLLTMWFRFGHLPEVYRVLSTGLSSIHVDTWLGVLPQLIARIHSSDDNSRTLLHELLVRLGARHVQALVYPMSVAVKSPLPERKQAAERIMNALRQHSNQLIDQALLVSQELIRVAILWHEQWHEGLEEASRLYFGEGNIQGMFDKLFPLHEELERGPTTLRESSFADAYANELQEAHDNLKSYMAAVQASGREVPTGRAAPGMKSRKRLVSNDEDQLLQRAWHLYYTVFKRINKQLPHHMTLELEYVSPALQSSRDLDLAVPGTYRVSGKAVRIRSFGEVVHVISSKQRPRKLTMYGEDGELYTFLLKGHEDLRQDERTMQLFGLVNALLERDRVTANYDLSIRRYAVVPLSPNTGLVGWVPECDTLHTLIRDYRDKRNVVLNIEYRLMSQMYQEYDGLTLMQKLEAFEYALDNTDGQDLYKVLWLKSDTSEMWLQRRANYTRSLAVMSMVGYILGLGDRHPSNLMLDRSTGKVVHIDFGDCFEVAMHRERFPEKVPFRLTRMLTRAMEVSGIEGNYRLTCERVMVVLRDNRQSLLAMLEAFVHDPLISWRLLHPKKGEQADNDNTPPAQGMAPIAEESHANDAADQSIEEGEESEDDEQGNEKKEEAPHDNVVAKPRTDDIHGSNGHDSDAETSDSDAEHDGKEDDADSDSSGSDGEMDGATQPNHQNQPGSPPQQAPQARRRSVVGSRFSYYGSQIHTKMMGLAASIQDTRYDGSIASSRFDHRSTRERIMVQALGLEGAEAPQEELTEKAVVVIRRVQDKLTGMDFGNPNPLGVPEQVERLIQQATDNENLCQSFVGWCPFW